MENDGEDFGPKVETATACTVCCSAAPYPSSGVRPTGRGKHVCVCEFDFMMNGTLSYALEACPSHSSSTSGWQKVQAILFFAVFVVNSTFLGGSLFIGSILSSFLRALRKRSLSQKLMLPQQLKLELWTGSSALN